jgi:hypothetical protein
MLLTEWEEQREGTRWSKSSAQSPLIVAPSADAGCSRAGTCGGRPTSPHAYLTSDVAAR